MTPTPEDHEAAARERITAAAISQDGVIYTGPHHAAIIHYIARCAGIKPVTGEQGFITSNNRFARRKTALLIAIRAGQVERSVDAPHGLMSEMLWSVSEDEWTAAALSEAVRVAVEGEREADCVAVCDYCRYGWPWRVNPTMKYAKMSGPLLRMHEHTVPESMRDDLGDTIQCDATPIRARSDAQATPAPETWQVCKTCGKQDALKPYAFSRCERCGEVPVTVYLCPRRTPPKAGEEREG